MRIADQQTKSKTASSVEIKSDQGSEHQADHKTAPPDAKTKGPTSSNAPETESELAHEAASKSRALLKQVDKHAGSVQR